MDNENKLNKENMILSDEELMSVVGGVDSDISVGLGGKSGIEAYCEGFDTPALCNSRYLCQWGQFRCHPHPRAYTVVKNGSDE